MGSAPVGTFGTVLGGPEVCGGAHDLLGLEDQSPRPKMGSQLDRLMWEVGTRCATQ